MRWTLGKLICGKQSTASSQYQYCEKNVVVAVPKLDREDLVACAPMVQYLTKTQCFKCSPNGYEITFAASFLQTISVRR